jgi:TolB-like protein
MPLVEGETLAARLVRGPLSIEDAGGIAAQIADALATAHAHAILHRDIKPANIMIDARGQARVMDFGLAKFAHVDEAAAEAAETMRALTAVGSTLGTAAYMSPEQARGEQVDARSDLFSLGVVVHEMVAGRRPFDGPSVADTVTAILTSEPLPLAGLRPGVPEELQRIVSKLLRKRRDGRYQSAADLLVDLQALLRQIQRAPASAPSESLPARSDPPQPSHAVGMGWVAAVVAVIALTAAGSYVVSRSRSGAAPAAASAAMPHFESLAVLPLANISADPSQEYFAQAMTEELINQLSTIKSLRVISRTSSGQYSRTKLSMPEIATQLHVDGLIEGSVVRDGDRVRITAQLIYGPADRHVWANAYDGDLRDMLALQRRVAEAIAREVRATVTPAEQQALRGSRSVDRKAMELYLKGRESFSVATHTAPGDSQRAPTEDAISKFTEALKIQEWAEAYAGLADARAWLGTGFNENVQFPLAREAALKAIKLDDGVADAHGELGYVAFAYDWDMVTAEREYRRALELSPNSNHLMSFALVLEALGRFDEARGMLDKAEERDPLSPVVKQEQVRGRLLAKDYVEAIRRARQLPDSFGAGRHLFVGQALLAEGRFGEAIQEFEQADQGFATRAAMASTLARAGRTGEAHTRLRELESTARSTLDASDLAGVYMSLGDRARALDALERAYAGRQIWLPLINVQPAFSDLHGDARFEDLLHRVGIPPGR